MTQTPDLTPADYQRIIATLSSQKAQAELAALEWQVRYEAAVQHARDVHEGEVVEPDSGTRDA